MGGSRARRTKGAEKTRLIPADAERVLADVVLGHAPALVARREPLGLPQLHQAVVFLFARGLDGVSS